MSKKFCFQKISIAFFYALLTTILSKKILTLRDTNFGSSMFLLKSNIMGDL